MHTPLKHCWSTVQPLPQVPQFCGSVLRFTQLFPHCVKPVLHCQPHTPLVQVTEELDGPEQTRPQAPQFCGSLLRFLHTPPQSNQGVLQAHWTPSQNMLGGQTFPQAPQLLSLLLRLMH